MPVYESRCKHCESIYEYVRPFRDYLDTPVCCGEKTSKLILSAPATRMDIQPWDAYESPATGKMITSYAQRREDMKVSGCRDWEGRPAEKKMAAQWREYEAKKEDAALEKEIGETLRYMDHDKKKVLLSGE